jgi:hypothetical protein
VKQWAKFKTKQHKQNPLPSNFRALAKTGGRFNSTALWPVSTIAIKSGEPAPSAPSQIITAHPNLLNSMANNVVRLHPAGIHRLSFEHASLRKAAAPTGTAELARCAAQDLRGRQNDGRRWPSVEPSTYESDQYEQ